MHKTLTTPHSADLDESPSQLIEKMHAFMRADGESSAKQSVAALQDAMTRKGDISELRRTLKALGSLPPTLPPLAPSNRPKVLDLLGPFLQGAIPSQWPCFYGELWAPYLDGTPTEPVSNKPITYSERAVPGDGHMELSATTYTDENPAFAGSDTSMRTATAGFTVGFYRTPPLEGPSTLRVMTVVRAQGTTFIGPYGHVVDPASQWGWGVVTLRASLYAWAIGGDAPGSSHVNVYIRGAGSYVQPWPIVLNTPLGIDVVDRSVGLSCDVKVQPSDTVVVAASVTLSSSIQGAALAIGSFSSSVDTGLQGGRIDMPVVALPSYC